MVITICSSVNFYKQAVEVQAELEKTRHFKVVLPATAEIMKQSRDYEVSHYKPWFKSGDYNKKTKLTRGHFNKVTDGDAILVVNYEKNGQQNYIGGAVLMEMGVAFYLNKKIFILNEIPEDSAFAEEIKALRPVVLHGNLTELSHLK